MQGTTAGVCSQAHNNPQPKATGTQTYLMDKELFRLMPTTRRAQTNPPARGNAKAYSPERI